MAGSASDTGSFPRPCRTIYLARAAPHLGPPDKAVASRPRGDVRRPGDSHGVLTRLFFVSSFEVPQHVRIKWAAGKGYIPRLPEVPRAALQYAEWLFSPCCDVAKSVAGEKLPVTRKLNTGPCIQLFSHVHIAARTNFSQNRERHVTIIGYFEVKSLEEEDR
jgi:hypothetical protein